MRKLLLGVAMIVGLAMASLAQVAAPVTVTSTRSAVVATVGGFTAVLYENNVSPTAIFSVIPGAINGSSISVAAGGSFTFARSSGFPFQAGDVLGYVTSTTSGPFTFTLVQYASTPGAVIATRCPSTFHVNQVNPDGSFVCTIDSGVGGSPPAGSVGALQINASGVFGALASPGQCTNQFSRGITILGDSNCSTVGQNDVDSSIALASQLPTPNAVPGTSQLLTGGGVAWTGGLNLLASPATYTIAGVQYSSAQTALTLATADPTNDRIDAVVVDNTGVVSVITGTPAPTPVQPNVDPSSQIQLTFAYVAANGTTPSSLTETDIYLENTEWTCAATANFNCASTNNPYQGTKDIEATSAVAGNNGVLTKPTTTLTLSSYNNLVLYIRSKAAWPSAKSLAISWLNGTTVVGTSVGLKTGQFGFSSTNTSSYQQVVIPITSFGAKVGSDTVSKLKIQVAGSSTAIGFYIDNVFLQGGIAAAPVALPTMLFRGTWNSTSTYNPNDVVVSSGALYVALLANSNSTPSGSATNWTPFVGSASVASAQLATANTRRSCSIILGADNAGSALLDADIAPQKEQCQVPFAATISEIDVTADAGTPQVVVSKRHCTANPCSSNFTVTDLTSSALATASSGGPGCSKTGATTGFDAFTTCSATLQNTSLAAGDYVETHTATAGGTAKRMSILVHYTVN